MEREKRERGEGEEMCKRLDEKIMEKLYEREMEKEKRERGEGEEMYKRLEKRRREKREGCYCGRMIHKLLAFQYCSFTDFRFLNPHHETNGYVTFSTNFA